MINISIVTFTLGGRPKYLIDCIKSVSNDIFFGNYARNNPKSQIYVEHHIVFQGIKTDEVVLNEAKTCSQFHKLGNYKAVIHELPSNIGIGAGLNKFIPECKGELIFKMDDDCKIVSEDFFYRAFSLFKRFPHSVFSPFPAGLIRSPGGSLAGQPHKVWWDKTDDVIYTKRIVHHIGGFARFAPKAIMDRFKFPPDKIRGISGTEDGDFSSFCNKTGIELFYVENALMVEHNESTLGQILRYPEYFQGRNYEGNVNLTVED